jgi:hypothetical protein
MSDLVEKLLSKIADLIMFIKYSFKYGQITIFDKATVQVGFDDYTHKSLRILIPMVDMGYRNTEIFEEQETFMTLYFSSKISVVRNYALDFTLVRFQILGFGFQYSSKFKVL